MYHKYVMKKIISIGFEMPGYSDDMYKPYTSSQSLLDADIIVFRPDFSNYHSKKENYQGKQSFDQNCSSSIMEDTRHWHSEISTALNEGKTVFVFMNQYEEIFVDTGEREYSGTGRNARVTSMVSRYDNYKFLPLEIPKLVPKVGSELNFSGHSAFINFWNEFKECLVYESYIDGKVEVPLFLTKTGNKAVGGLFHVGKGSLVLLPSIKTSENFTEYDEEHGECWSEDAVKFGKRLLQMLIDIDNVLRKSIEASPPPNWITKKEYVLGSEISIRKKVESASKNIEKFTQEKNILLNDLQKEIELKNLLFEKGRPLESAVTSSLKVLGYKAENYDDGNLEIDQIIIDPEGQRYVGETEGKDNSAVGIDKFRQLESNIQEDFHQESISDPAIGILFGNGFRNTSLEDRSEQFTNKCIKNAERLNTILIRTSDLFSVVKYIIESSDKEFSKKCRKEILKSRGKIVDFSKISKNKKTAKKKK